MVTPASPSAALDCPCPMVTPASLSAALDCPCPVPHPRTPTPHPPPRLPLRTLSCRSRCPRLTVIPPDHCRFPSHEELGDPRPLLHRRLGDSHRPVIRAPFCPPPHQHSRTATAHDGAPANSVATGLVVWPAVRSPTCLNDSISIMKTIQQYFTVEKEEEELTIFVRFRQAGDPPGEQALVGRQTTACKPKH
jgi:hypothetical protein